jgi:putative lipoic acid-binding regulatory protein
MNRKVAAECLQFPCSFPLKVMGLNSEAFEHAVLDALYRDLNGHELVVMTL